METKDLQSTFQTLSFLLSYPDEEWHEKLGVCNEIVAEIEDKEIQGTLTRFLTHLHEIGEQKLRHEYVKTFDFGKKTNLYITYFNSGEQRERGMELLQLKEWYKSAGFLVTERELPDYLPLMLGFATVADEESVRKVFSKYVPNIEELRKQLHTHQSFYTLLLDCLLRALEQLGVEKTLEGAV